MKEKNKKQEKWQEQATELTEKQVQSTENNQESNMHGKSLEVASDSETEQDYKYIIRDTDEKHVLRITTDIILGDEIPKFLTERQLWHHTDWELEQLRKMLERRELKEPTDEVMEEWLDAINLA